MLRPQLVPYSRVSTPVPQSFTPINGPGTPVAREDTNTVNNNNKNKHGFIHPKDYEKPKVGQLLKTFETSLASFIGSVSKFHPSMTLAENLVISENELARSISELVRHHEAAKRIYELKQQSKALDDELETLLITLSDCRRTLRALPKPDEKFLKQLPEGILDYTKELVKLSIEEEEEEEEEDGANGDKPGELDTNDNNKSSDKTNSDKEKKSEYFKKLEQLRQQRRRSSLALNGKIGPEKPKVSARELLDYATRITKFTSAPPGFNGQGNGDFNYPWPSEDELRKGMMALSQMQGIKEIEDGQQQVNVPHRDIKTSENPPEPVAAAVTTTNPIVSPSSSSSSSSSVMAATTEPETVKKQESSKPADIPEQKAVPTAKLDLDFYDSDEDDDL